MRLLSFETNNGRQLTVEQADHDGHVLVIASDENGEKQVNAIIRPETFVMLMNMYTYVKENDIQNDFINPTGKNKEVI